ncbi:Chloroplast protein import component Tic20 [Babesia duncani]|uniref:Chloroplast protein import component Tic20 n=1 Tax=Babesia duncani TaxID=323732 RepID=A0AAD9PNN4_9APIC|nr:Chloroplast protein import component Tic20 [Babesia duncani]
MKKQSLLGIIATMAQIVSAYRLNSIVMRHPNSSVNFARPFSTRALPTGAMDPLQAPTAATNVQVPSTALERLIAASAYAMPLGDALEGFGEMVIDTYAPPESISHAIMWGMHYSFMISQVPFLKFGIVSLLHSAVLKETIAPVGYLIKYHMLQAMILNTFQQVLAAFFSKLVPYSHQDPGFISTVTTTMVAMASFGAIAYCIAHSLMGNFVHLPVISDAVKLHIGDPQDELQKSRAP